MAIKQFCDACNKELVSNCVDDRMTRVMTINGHEIKAEVMVTIDGVTNNGELCQSCLSKVLEQGNPR